ncbi:MAG: cell division protein [Spirochaetaceae bacterium]|nr:cell division protein [Spirochaetaceae bacterium]|tara:strand:+ start:9636 stop:11114 length:1479 start_codon:yes stop_codon:yes gene_type:complete
MTAVGSPMAGTAAGPSGGQVMSGEARKPDLWIFLFTLILGGTGLMILLSASALQANLDLDDPYFYAKRQAVFSVAGVIGLFVIASFSPKMLRKLALPSMLFSLLLLLLVFVPGVGRSVASSRDSFHRWIDLGFFSFQPSEFAKVALVLYLASMLLDRKGQFEQFSLKELLRSMILVGSVLAAILLEPQYGTTLTLISVISVLIFVAGFPVLRLVLLGLSLLPLLAMLLVLWEYRFERFQVWLDPYAYRYAGGYQLVTAFRAFGEGGWIGQELASGFGHRYLTFGHTDFVLALFSEDYGFAGVAVLLCLYGALLWRSIILLRRQKDEYLFLLGCGAVTILFLQVIVNLFVVTGIIPTTGISLPFVSYGGSSLIVSYALCGLLWQATALPASQAPRRTPRVKPASVPVANPAMAETASTAAPAANPSSSLAPGSQTAPSATSNASSAAAAGKPSAFRSGSSAFPRPASKAASNYSGSSRKISDRDPSVRALSLD